MTWNAISWKSEGPMIFFMKVLKRDHLQILSDQVHHMAKALFPERNAIFQDDNAPIYTARIVKE